MAIYWNDGPEDSYTKVPNPDRMFWICLLVIVLNCLATMAINWFVFCL